MKCPHLSLRAKSSKTPTNQIIREIKTPLSNFKKLLIRRYLLPRCLDSVGYRENTKSILVKFQDNIRDAFWQIAQDLAMKGILPDAELMFYLKLDEIKRLTSGERNPGLVMKAKHRKQLYPIMDKLKFDEFIKGFRMKPIVKFKSIRY